VDDRNRIENSSWMIYYNIEALVDESSDVIRHRNVQRRSNCCDFRTNVPRDPRDVLPDRVKIWASPLEILYP
jgi:hypothetical protein